MKRRRSRRHCFPPSRKVITQTCTHARRISGWSEQERSCANGRKQRQDGGQDSATLRWEIAPSMRRRRCSRRQGGQSARDLSAAHGILRWPRRGVVRTMQLLYVSPSVSSLLQAALKNRSIICERDSRGMTPIHVACRNWSLPLACDPPNQLSLMIKRIRCTQHGDCKQPRACN